MGPAESLQRVVIASLVCAVIGGSCSAVIAQNDLRLLRIPDPLSGETPPLRLLPQEVPLPGVPSVDSRFGTRLTRVTRQPGIRHEYARFDPFNKDQSLIMLVVPSAGEFRVYRTHPLPFDDAGNFVRTVDFEEPRWDPQNANLLWGLREFRIETLDVATGETATVKDFALDPRIGPLLRSEPDLYRITTKDEGESSRDKRVWAFMLQGSEDDHNPRYVFVWERQQDRILGLHALPPGGREVDWVGMSPLGKWVLLGGEWDNGGRIVGQQIANPELSAFHQIDATGGHGDVGLDADGREVFVVQNSRTDCIDMLPLSGSTKAIADGNTGYDGTNRIPLVRLFYASDSPIGFNSGVHISCNCLGWCVVSTYIEPGAEARNWLDRSLILLRLDARHPEAFYLAKLHNTTGTYWEETHATISNDGARVVWADNWGQSVGQEKCFLMQLDRPPRRISQ